ncbi:MAG: EscS/YscS/HrcS family type III secretion system export apparatus protein [Bdellovibrionales bacterium RIFCSPHIGHO2_01_FULL_40_29]|nr:MAG: EscS/YscS/HrcS family type III secretion system export apparatus protein [Bdellovibrionales bacterium RIFCSPHIGHO2_01_FULL_40_29]OFZ32831.1 MAG: EscS/YscS/HrcS family type III secretion system export apparatus protein [Bdellovibrionales bacterium RIFCSPHIGHO2_02_FULL_40_15]
MNEDIVIQLGQDALKTLAMVAAPMLLSTLIIGLIISIFQALTQINENTLTFVPKMVVIAIVLILAGPWMLDTLSTYTVSLFDNISTVVRGP